jgi:hypothetical protein
MRVNPKILEVLDSGVMCSSHGEQLARMTEENVRACMASSDGWNWSASIESNGDWTSRCGYGSFARLRADGNQLTVNTCGGHSFTITVSEDGNVSIEVDAEPSHSAWRHLGVSLLGRAAAVRHELQKLGIDADVRFFK